MRPLTERTPKALLEVSGRPLIEHHLVRLAAAGYTEVVVNVAHLGNQLVDFLGDGSRWGLMLQISSEEEPLETAGGIVQALPLLGGAPFLLVNADVFTDYPFQNLRDVAVPQRGGHLVLVPNPAQHPEGDFRLDGSQIMALNSSKPPSTASAEVALTYAGIALFDPSFFADTSFGKRPLRPLFDLAIDDQRLSGEYYGGLWADVGTPERLDALNRQFPSP